MVVIVRTVAGGWFCAVSMGMHCEYQMLKAMVSIVLKGLGGENQDLLCFGQRARSSFGSGTVEFCLVGV